MMKSYQRAKAPTNSCGEYMYRKTVIATICFTLSGAAAWLNAGEIRQNFLKIKDENETQASQARFKEETLINNMQRALKMSLLRHYSLCNYEKTKIDGSNIEISDENPNMYYFQYEKFAGYFIFSQNPREYLQIPIDEKILLESGAVLTRLQDPECSKDTPTTKPAPATKKSAAEN